MNKTTNYETFAHAAVRAATPNYWVTHFIVGESTPTELRAIADRFDQVVAYFKANPRKRYKGALSNETATLRVCAMGAVRYNREIGLKWTDFASKNCNANQTMEMMNSMGVVMMNDSSIKAEQFYNWTTNCARLIRQFAKLPANQRTVQSWRSMVEADPYFGRWL